MNVNFVKVTMLGSLYNRVSG